MKEQKYIKVLSRGYVTTNRGRAFTPITRTFKESTRNIFTMITKEKATVVEVLSNGKEIQLTPQNFDKDNEVLEVKKTIAVTVATPVAEVAPEVDSATTSDEWVPAGETTDEEWVRSDDGTTEEEEAVEETEETSDEQSTSTQQDQQYYGKRNKKNRHRNGNGAPQVTPETV